jgi:hypothetical protein
MVDYVGINRYEEGNQIGVVFNVTDDKPFAVGEKMTEIDENAYMNGYNWEAFFNFYLAETAPELLEDLETDTEASTYIALYPLSVENEKKAERFAKLIESLIEEETELLRIVRERGEEIEWD